MQELIDAKFNEYKANIPQSHDFKFWLAKTNVWGWLYSMFIVQGQNVSKDCLADLLDGNLRNEVPLSCYSFVHGYKDVYQDMQQEIGMQTTPSLKLFKRWASLIGFEDYRKNNPVAYEIGLIPCHFRTIDEELEAAFKKYVTSKEYGLKKATLLCLDVIKVYPYDDGSIDMALLVFMYCLMLIGYPIPELYVNQGEFNNLVTDYMSDKKTCEPFYNMIKKSVYNRLDAVVMFEKQILEK